MDESSQTREEPEPRYPLFEPFPLIGWLIELAGEPVARLMRYK